MAVYEYDHLIFFRLKKKKKLFDTYFLLALAIWLVAFYIVVVYIILYNWK